MKKKQSLFSWFFLIAALASTAPLVAQVDRIELGYQTTKRGIVWYRPGLPTHVPAWKFSRDTNAVLWHDTLTAIRYDWDYTDDRWRAKGTFSGALPPRPQQTSGAALIDNRTAFWIRDTFNLLHKYDSTANAWTPMGDWFYLSSVPTDIAATGSNGAAKYRRSLWQNSGTFEVRYWDGDSWEPFTGDGSETIVTAGTGISVTGDGTAGTPYVVTNTGDLSNTNELQAYGHAGTTSYTNTLSLSGGSFTIQAGTNVTISHTAGTVTISASDDSGGGIYGNGTAGSGSDTLPPGGSTVTIPGEWQPLKFMLDVNSTTEPVVTAIQVITDLCGDDVFSKYFVGKSPVDSLEIYNFDCGTIIKQTGGQITIQGDREMILMADSIQATTLPQKTTLSYITGLTNQDYIGKIKGTANDQILKWSQTNNRWEIGTDNTGSGGVTGTGTANRFTYWTGTTTVAADDDAVFDGTSIGFGTTTLTGKVNINAGTSTAPLHLNAYGSASGTSHTVGQVANTNTAGSALFSLNQEATANTIRAGIRRFGSTHASRPRELNITTFESSAPVTIGTNDLVRMTVASDVNVYVANKLAAGFGTTVTGAHSTVQSAGSFAGAVLETVGSPTFDDTKWIVTYTGTTNVNWTLPAASGCEGRMYYLFHRNTSGTITLSTSVSKGNGGNFNTITAGQLAIIWSTGSAWNGIKVTSL